MTHRNAEPTPVNARPRVVVIGAGPAGLTAAYSLCRHGARPIVLEADPERVGGISRTVEFEGYFFDIGGHRFFSKSREIEDLWTELLGDDMLWRDRKSRILWRGRFFAYPLRPLQALPLSVLHRGCLRHVLPPRAAAPDARPDEF